MKNIKFEIKRHIEIIEGFQGMNLTEFGIGIDEQMNNDLIIDHFIHSKQFSFDSLRHSVKFEPDKGYLRRAFNFDRINIHNFKKFDKQGVSKFLYDFMHEEDWGNDRKEFVNLLDKYLKIQDGFSNREFYVLSMDWFEKEDERLLEPEGSIYVYYFLIISVDSESNLLTLAEWTYD